MTRFFSSSTHSVILIYLLLAVTTFEYFFRYTPLVYILYVICFFLVIIKKPLNTINTRDAVFFALVYSCSGLITLVNGGAASSAIGRILESVGTILISVLIYKGFTKNYVSVMVFISIIALVFYVFYFIDPVKTFIFGNVAPHFPSLNMGNFTNEVSDTGGGINIVIHNYHNGGVSLRTGNLYRNCGPFWEPGQFAVFLNIALFFVFFDRQIKNRGIKALILFSALITTFSTGGFVAFLFILFVLALRHSSKIYIKALAFVAFIAFAYFFYGSEYMGDKIVEEMSSSADDNSRFSAFFIQLRAVVDNPVFGGEWRDYTQATTSANGILLPFVYWGIPFGLVYYLMVYLSFKRLFIYHKYANIVGRSFFALILILAFSQTITVTRWFLVLIVVGFLSFNNENEYINQ